MSKKSEVKLVVIGEINSTKKATTAPKVTSGDMDFDKFVQEAMSVIFKPKEK